MSSAFKGTRNKLRQSGFSAEVIDKAVQKAKRWMKNAYGDIDWNELEAECGSLFDAILPFCEECVREPAGINTHNRSKSRDKEQILEKFGKKDGHDETRWNYAVHFSGIQDRHVQFVFESLIRLEDKGLIALKTESTGAEND